MGNPVARSSETLDQVVRDVRKAYQDDRAILSFKEYFALMCEKPEQHLRSASQYVVDMIDHFGYEDLQRPMGQVRRYKVFDAQDADSEGKVSGQEMVQDAIVKAFENFAREGKVNKLILMHGPNGSAKSSIVRALMQGLDVYGRTPKGAMYSFNWIFPTEKSVAQDRIGFGARHNPDAVGDSYAYLPSEAIDARIPCSMRDHPVFLVPQPDRMHLIRSLLPEPSPDVALSGKPHTVISDTMKHGDLCYKCRRIFDALMTSYDGDVQKVFNHIQIERFYPSRRYRCGIATIEPQSSVDARIHQLTSDRSLAALPKSLQYTSLFEPSGPIVDANRGMLEYADFLKRPVEAFKYLLATVETSTLSMDSFLLHLDMVFIASTNEIYLDAFKEHPDFTSFKGRMELIKVPYLLRYDEEREIYVKQVTARVVGKHVAPHAADVASLWAVLTRMRRNDSSLYDKSIRDVIDSITPLEKLYMYNDGTMPSRLSNQQANEIRGIIRDLYRESLRYPNYEGRFGASVREIRTALLNAAHDENYTCLHPLSVFSEIEELFNSRGVYEFLKQEVVGKFHDHRAFLKTTQDLYLTWAADEVRASMGLATEESHQARFARYVQHISHWVKRERIMDQATGKARDPDEKLMGEVERVLLGEQETSTEFRNAVISSIAAKHLDSPDEEQKYHILFKDYINRLKEDFYNKHSDDVRKNNENFLRFAANDVGMMDEKDIANCKAMLAYLESKFGYCLHCARDTVAHIVKHQYTAA